MLLVSDHMSQNLEMSLLILLLGSAVIATEPSNDSAIVIIGYELMSVTSPAIDLDLSGREIIYIEPNAFANCSSVKTLDLSDNVILKPPLGVFSPMANLEHLSLADNDLRTGYLTKVFVGLDKLKSLNITENNMGKILHSDDFVGLPKSCEIYIGGESPNFEIITPEAFGKHEKPDSPVPKMRSYPSASEDRKCPEGLSNDIEVFELEGSRTSIEFENLQRDFLEEGIYSEDRAKICTRNNKVMSVNLFDANETIPTNCKSIYVYPTRTLLRIYEMNITSFEKRWFNIRDSSFNAIYLFLNSIEELTSELLNDLPENIKFVSLQRSGLKRLNRGAIANEHLRGLDLSINAINFIEDDTFVGTNLTRLNLRNNKLKDLKFTMTLPASLLSLNLEFNEIHRIPVESFSRLKKLLALRLCGNDITELEPRSLNGLESLQLFELCSAKVTKLRPGVFHDLGNLYDLRLNGNTMTTLDKGVFEGLVCLAKMDLSANNLTKFDKNDLHGLTDRFDELRLNSNELEILQADSFVGIPKTQLSLKHNKIRDIEAGAFDLPHLIHLDLTGNNITGFEKGALKNLGYSVENENIYIKLSFNPIDRLERCALAGLPRKSRVDLSDTPVRVIVAGVFDDV